MPSITRYQSEVARHASTVVLLAAVASSELRAAHEGKAQLVLPVDSTAEAGISNRIAPSEPQFEDVILGLLAAKAELP